MEMQFSIALLFRILVLLTMDDCYSEWTKCCGSLWLRVPGDLQPNFFPRF